MSDHAGEPMETDDQAEGAACDQRSQSERSEFEKRTVAFCRPSTSSTERMEQRTEQEMVADRPANEVAAAQVQPKPADRKRPVLRTLSGNVPDHQHQADMSAAAVSPSMCEGANLLYGALHRAFTEHMSTGPKSARTGLRHDSGYGASVDGAVIEDEVVGSVSSKRKSPFSRSSSDEDSLPVRHFDSFDSAVDTVEKRQSLTRRHAFRVIETSSGIDLTYSASPVKQITHKSWQVFQENYDFNRKREGQYRAEKNYMDRQEFLDPEMRAVLIDWLVDVCREFNLSQETLHVAISMVDQFLSLMCVSREKLQLVGIVATMIAAKFLEIYPPKVKQFVAVTDDTYTQRQMLKMERILLMAVNFAIHPPTLNEFIAAYTYVAGAARQTQFLAQYLGDLALQEYEFVPYLPSQLGAAATWLALGTCESEWQSEELKCFSGYRSVELLPVMERMLQIWRKPTRTDLMAIRNKYTADEFLNVALIPAPRALPL